MKNGKASHSKNGNNGIPASIVKNWFDKTEKILWELEEGHKENRVRIRQNEEEIKLSKQMVVELKKFNQEQSKVNALNAKVILRAMPHRLSKEEQVELLKQVLASKKS